MKQQTAKYSQYDTKTLKEKNYVDNNLIMMF